MRIARASSLIAFLLGALLIGRVQGADDPAGLFLQAYQEYKAAERFETDGRIQDAVVKYRFCASLLEQIQRKHPAYEPIVIEFRLKKSRESIARAEAMKTEAAEGNPSGENELEGPLPRLDEPSYAGRPKPPSPAPSVSAPPARAAPSVSFQGSYRIPLPGGSTTRPPARNPAESRTAAPAPTYGGSEVIGRGAALAYQEEIQALRGKLHLAERRAEELNEKLLQTMGREQSALREVDKTKVSVVELKAQLAQVRQALSNADEENQRLTKEKTTDSTRIASLETDLEAARADLEVAEDYNSELFAKLEQASRYIADSDQIRGQLLTERNELSQRLKDGATAEIALLTARNNTLTAERDKALAINEDQAGQLKEAEALREQNRMLEGELSKAEKKVAALAAVQPEQEKTVQQLRDELASTSDRLTKERDALIAQNQAAQKNLEDLAGQKEDLAGKLAAAEEEAKKLKSAAPEQERTIADLRKNLESATAQWEKEREDLVAKNAETARKLEQAAKFEKEKESLAGKLAEAQEEVQKLASIEPEREKTILELRNELASVREQFARERTDLLARAGEARKNVESLAAEKSDLAAKLAAAEEEAKKLGSVGPEQERTIADLRGKLESSTVQWEKERADLMAKNQEAASEAAKFGQESKSLAEKLAAAEGRIQDLAGQDSDREKLISDLRARVAAAITDTDKARGEAAGSAALSAQNTELSEKLARAEDQVQSLNQRIPEREKLIADLQGELDSVNAKLAGMKESLDAGQERVSELEKQLEDTSSATTLATGAMAEENALLKSIVTRQLQEQAKRQQARKLVGEEMEKLQIRSTALIEQLNALGGAEAMLTDKERKLFEAPVASVATEGGRNSLNIAMVVEKKMPESESKSERASNDLPEGLTARAASANELFRADRFKEAEAIYQQLVEEAPESYFAKVNLGVTQLRQAEHARAIDTLRESLRLRPGDAFALTNIGIAQLRSDLHSAAVETLKTAVDASPDQYLSHYFLGLALNAEGDLEGAMRELRRAIDLNPGYAQAHLNLAIIYATTQPPSKELARRHYSKATSLGASPDASLEQLIR